MAALSRLPVWREGEALGSPRSERDALGCGGLTVLFG